MEILDFITVVFLFNNILLRLVAVSVTIFVGQVYEVILLLSHYHVKVMEWFICEKLRTS